MTDYATLLKKEKRKIALITDHHLKSLYEHLFDCKIFSIPPGEGSKTREMKHFLEDELLSHGFGKDSLLVGFGGGVVLDITGFLASTYCRGVPHIFIPTSLLAMVDASIGGKTGVNTPFGKNLIGSFYPPKDIWLDGQFLQTLPEKQWINGMVEMVKVALIDSPDLFESLTSNWKNRDIDWMMDQVEKSIQIKQKIVNQDPKEEKGIRKTLNLGHTIGHALEVLENYQIEHGEAVAIGIIASCYISNQMGILDTSSFEKIRKSFEILLKLSKKHSFDAMMNILKMDKKGANEFVLLKSIGKVASFNGSYSKKIEPSLLKEAIEWTFGQFVKAPLAAL